MVDNMQENGKRDAMEEVFRLLPTEIAEALAGLSPRDRALVTELRLRVNRSAAVTVRGETMFLSRHGRLCLSPADGLPVTASLLRETLLCCTGHSLHSCADQLRQGYLTLSGGHRVGVAGLARSEHGKVLSVQEVTALNIRIAWGVSPLADRLLEQLFSAGLTGTLLAGPPHSGKTTLLRQMAARLGGGWQGQYRRVAVVDERGELAGCGGETVDILTGYPKGAAIELAIRSLSPQLLVCDELAAGEAEAVEAAALAGVPLLATVHGGSLQELGRKRWLLPLFRQEVFQQTALLGSDFQLKAVEKGGLPDAVDWCGTGVLLSGRCRISDGVSADPPGGTTHGYRTVAGRSDLSGWRSEYAHR